ncbi:B962L [African swine fever virus]|uniref:B962L n=1 Tax=African swine fever virus TaxID=10497 RepID=A0A5B8XBB4_ASF|nr:B962L [African swine fever virus]
MVRKKMLKYSSMVQILARREDILNELAIVGLNPFHQWQNRLASANAETFLKRVCTLKQCMYEAYRLNCFCYDEHRLLLYWKKWNTLFLPRCGD